MSIHTVKASKVKPDTGKLQKLDNFPHEGDGGMDINKFLSCGHVRMRTLELHWFMHAVIKLTREYVNFQVLKCWYAACVQMTLKLPKIFLNITEKEVNWHFNEMSISQN